jgi:hypothetical protein
VIRKSYAALQNLVTSLPNPDPNPMLSGQVESESEKTGSDPHHWLPLPRLLLFLPAQVPGDVGLPCRLEKSSSSSWLHNFMANSMLNSNRRGLAATELRRLPENSHG